MKQYQGFTLIELLMVLAILAVLFAFAVPSYQEYARKKDRAAAQQTMQRVAMELEQFRGKNFSYRGFSTTTSLEPTIYRIVITDASGISLTDARANGFAWRMYAERKDPATQARNYDLLMTSAGIRCMTRSLDTVQKGNCGSDKDTW